ncbi:MAG: SGNH/GDSL hydrolase family protein [Gemmatimonadaceae bacterium]
MSNRILLRGAASAVLLGGVAVACTDNTAKVLGPQLSGANSIFQSYVALGNSITAGYQSGGISDSTQQRSYAVLLAKQMGTRFAYPSLANPGCPPPVNNFNSQSRVTPTGFPTSTSSSCYLRANTVAILNNVAVPGATSFDPDAASSTLTPSANLLTQLILGGENQVQRAREANPTFATVWIGNNDVLAPAVSGVLVPSAGISPGVTPQATFTANYDKFITDLTAGNTNLKGVLIGIVNVANAPVLFSAQVLQSPQFLGALSVAAGKPVTADPTTCTPTSASLISFQIVGAIRAGTHPATIYCEKTPQQPIGDVFVLDSQEIASLTAYVNSVNAYISTKAQSIGFAYLNPNQALDSLKQKGEIKPTGPDFNAPTAPFGKWISLDGAHPSTCSHILIADYLIDAINGKYSTSLAKLAIPAGTTCPEK